MRSFRSFLLVCCGFAACERTTPESIGVAPGTFAAAVDGPNPVQMLGCASWYNRRLPLRTMPGAEALILLHTRGPDAFPDTMVLFHRTSEPFRRGTYPIHPLVVGKGDSPDPVAQLVVRSHWDEEPRSWQSEAGSLRITRADERSIEGEFEFTASSIPAAAQPPRASVRGKFSAIHAPPGGASTRAGGAARPAGPGPPSCAERLNATGRTTERPGSH